MGSPKLNDADFVEVRNRLCTALEYRLWHKDKSTKLPVQLLRQVKGRQAILLKNDERKFPPGYDIWVVEVPGEDLPRDVSVAFLGKTLTEMEVLAWSAR